MNNKELPQTNMPYPYPMPYQDNDEIDLVELFGTLWKQKAKIVLITAVTTLAAGIYTFTAEEVWTSKAVIVPPRLEEISAYYKTTEELQRILQKSTIGDLRLEPEAIAEDVYNEFNKEIDSTDSRKEFWVSSEYFLGKSKEKSSPLDKQKLLDELIEKDIKLEIADGKKAIYTSVKLSADSAVSSKTLLESFLKQVNHKVWQSKKNELETVLDQEISELVREKEQLVFKAETQRKNNIKLSENARNIAEKANIKEFNMNAIQGNANVDRTDMLFFLGTKALDAQLDNLKNKPVTLPVRYYEIEKTLTELKGISQFENLNVLSYRYLMSPNEPVTRDKPLRALTLAIGLLVGLIIGCIIALVSSAIKSETVCN